MPATGNGLCDRCAHQQRVTNTRGSSFSLCLRSRTDSSYPRYPRTPVTSCPGFEWREQEERRAAGAGRD